MKRVTLLLCLTGLAGCSTDSAAGLSRDYRNLNNEAVDALMMSTSEDRAKLARDKVLKVYGDRLKAIDKRCEDWLRNTDDKLVVFETMDSESVITLLVETPINAKRLAHEQQRILAMCAYRAKEIADRMAIDGTLDRMRQEGVANPEAAIQSKAREEAKKEWPVLHAFAAGSHLSDVKMQLEKGNKFFGLVRAFKEDKKWKNQLPPNMEELTKQMEDRRKALEPVQ